MHILWTGEISVSEGKNLCRAFVFALLIALCYENGYYALAIFTFCFMVIGLLGVGE